MATRPIFMPRLDQIGVRTIEVDFEWFPGFSPVQKQKSVTALHQAFALSNAVARCLEVSSKSEEAIGNALSAFNLQLVLDDNVSRSVEVLFQGSKVFSNGGPYNDLYQGTSLAAKRDPRLKTSGELTAFEYQRVSWELVPTTGFYDYLYSSALLSNLKLMKGLEMFSAFSDIEFNPARSLNCQAMAVARFQSLSFHKALDLIRGDRQLFLEQSFNDCVGLEDQQSLF
jgi:hypothetical protein